MKMRHALTLATLAGCLWLGTAQAEVDGLHIGLTPYIGGSDWDERLAENDFVYGGRAAIILDRWVGVEGHYGHSPSRTLGTPSENLDVFPYGLDVIVNLAPSRRVVPYVLAGWTEFSASPSKGDDVTVNGWEFGGGAKFPLSERIGLRTEFRDAIVDRIGGDPDEWRHNFIYTVGLQFDVFGGVPDDDGDGIANRKDRCAATPAGATVDASGCPTDGDGDRIVDGVDRCPNTPKGAIVDASGCPIDGDGDGVPDGLDKCASTPKGAIVDATGCPTDGDGDGVADGLDKCANTMTGAMVDASGCPMDTDGDGVVDGVDQCPGTPKGAEVDAKGCQAMETMLLDTGLIRLETVQFESGKAALKPASYETLDAVGAILVNWPDLRIEIAGHTDSQGAESFNQTLSEKRAGAVLEYLTGKFPALDRGRFTAVGYGEGQPVADNSDATGRGLNRRVEFKVLNREVLEKRVPAHK